MERQWINAKTGEAVDMQAYMNRRQPGERARFLRMFGLDIDDSGDVDIANVEQATACGIHHSLIAIPAIGWTLAAPTFAQSRLAKTHIYQLLDRRPVMDLEALDLMAELCGIPASETELTTDAAFYRTLLEQIHKHDLHTYFGQYDKPLQQGIKPLGFKHDGTDDEIPEELAAWRRAYAAEPLPRQILIATILWLYSGRRDLESPWLEGFDTDWSAPTAIAALHNAGLLADWGRCVIRYSGW